MIRRAHHVAELTRVRRLSASVCSVKLLPQHFVDLHANQMMAAPIESQLHIDSLKQNLHVAQVDFRINPSL